MLTKRADLGALLTFATIVLALSCTKNNPECPNAAPTASFTVNPTSGTTQTIFQFDASSCSDAEDEASALQVRWDWENDGTWDIGWSATKTASHQYSAPGTKTIKLEVKDSGGATDDTTRTVTVSSPNTPPVASFTVNPAYGTVDTVFQFDASSCSDAEDTVAALEVRWDWENDGTWDTDWAATKTADHQYGATGTKTIKLEVKDSGGATDDTTRTVIVSGFNTPPVAFFTVNPSSGTTLTAFQFDASGSSDAEDAVSALQIRWDWEDDGTWDTQWSASKTASHQYESAGTKTIKLEVKDSGEATDDTTRTVTVSSPNTAPTASFTVNPATGTVDTVFQFDASGSSDAEDAASALQIRWDCENDGTWDTDWSTVKTANHQYGTTGIKSINLLVRDSEGLTDDTAQTVVVWSDDQPGGAPITQEELIGSANAFGFSLFKELVRENPDSNIIVSPLSVSMALGMLLNGACRATLEEMLSTLGLSGYSVQSANEVQRDLSHFLTSLDPKVLVEIANSVWCQEGFILKSAFTEACRTYFDADVRDIDFAGDPGAPDSINGWVSEKTHGRIPAIVQKPLPGPPPLLMLIDAVYFLGRWSKEFDPAYTSTEQFTLPTGAKRLCRMMKRPGPDPEPSHDNLCDYEYYSEYSDYGNEGLQIVDLAYGDSLFSMTILLPWGDSDVDGLIADLDVASWNGWLGALDDCHGRLFMPRFEVRFGRDLKDALMALGMVRAFVPGQAEFYRIADVVLWIERVLHATYLKVDESGTEAAAVTVIDIPYGNIPDCARFHMRVNRPFVFVIRDRHTNTILFIGKVADPGYY